MKDSPLLAVTPPHESESVVGLRPHQGQLPQPGGEAGGLGHHQLLGWSSAAEHQDEHDDDDDYDNGDTEEYEVDKVDLVIVTDWRLRDDAEVTLHVIVLYTGAALHAEDLAVVAGVGVPADALALLVVPGVGGAVETGELVPGEVRETVTGAGVR